MNPIVERLARAAGFGTDDPGRICSSVMPGTDISDDLEHFAALVAESCAQQCDELHAAGRHYRADNCAYAIRAAFQMPKETP